MLYEYCTYMCSYGGYLFEVKQFSFVALSGQARARPRATVSFLWWCTDDGKLLMIVEIGLVRFPFRA